MEDCLYEELITARVKTLIGNYPALSEMERTEAIVLTKLLHDFDKLKQTFERTKPD